MPPPLQFHTPSVHRKEAPPTKYRLNKSLYLIQLSMRIIDGDSNQENVGRDVLIVGTVKTLEGFRTYNKHLCNISYYFGYENQIIVATLTINEHTKTFCTPNVEMNGSQKNLKPELHLDGLVHHHQVSHLIDPPFYFQKQREKPT